MLIFITEDRRLNEVNAMDFIKNHKSFIINHNDINAKVDLFVNGVLTIKTSFGDYSISVKVDHCGNIFLWNLDKQEYKFYRNRKDEVFETQQF